MSIVLALAYFAVLIWASYRVGDRSAGYGIGLFIVGALSYSVYMHGWESLWQGDECMRYSSFARDC